MKKHFILSILAVTLILACNQNASAWSNIKFGAGVNLHWQTGDNNLLWGAFRNGQIPGPMGGYPGGGFPGYGPQFSPYPVGGHEHAATPAPAPAPAPAPVTSSAAPYNPVNQVSYPNPYAQYPFQPVSNQNYSYTTPYYPTYTPYQAPSYWYGK